MRILVFILAVFGGLGCGGLGFLMKSAEASDEVQLARELIKGEPGFEEANARLQQILFLSFALLTAFPLGVLGGLLALRRKRMWAGPLLLLAAAAPTFFLLRLETVPEDVIPLFVAGLGVVTLSGLLCFLVRPLPGPVTAAPASPPVEEKQAVPEAPGTKRPLQRQTSAVTLVLVYLLSVGGATALSILVALDVLIVKPDPVLKDSRRPPFEDEDLDQEKPGRGEDELPVNSPPDPPSDPKEGARLAAERAKKLALDRAREKPILAALRATPPEVEGRHLRILPGDKEMIGFLAFSPDGETVASADDKVIKLWNIRSGKELRALASHPDRILDIVFAPDGKQLVSACCDKAVRIWDVKSGKLEHLCQGHRDEVFSLALLPHSHLVLSGSEHELKAWDLRTGKFVRDVTQPSFRVGCLACSPTGPYIAYAYPLRSKVVLVNDRTHKVGRVLECGADVRQLAFSPDGKTLAVATDSSLKLWEVRTGTPVRSFPGELKEVRTLVFSPDGKWLIAGDRSSLTFWEASSGKANRTLRLPSNSLLVSISKLALSPGGTVLAIAAGKAVYLYAVEDLLDDRSDRAIEAVKKFATITHQGPNLRAEVSADTSDADLAKLKSLPHLVGLDLRPARHITDAGLTHLPSLTDLRELNLNSCDKITDAGLVHLKNLKQLTELNLGRLDKITDAGLAHLAGLTNLRKLYLNAFGRTKITPAGLAHLKGLTRLEVLNLEYVNLGNRGLVNLRGMTGLRELNLNYCGVGDTSLADLRGLVKLQKLVLEHNEAVTDPGLISLKGMIALRTLDLSYTGVTDAGFAHLAGLTNLKDLGLTSLQGLKGTGLAHCKGMKELKSLQLGWTGVTDAGLAGVKNLEQLEILDLPPAITDAGFVHLAGLKNLKELRLGALPRLKGPGLAHCKGMKGLKALQLRWTGVTDAGLVGVRNLTQLETLELPPAITDAGFIHLAGLKNLKELRLDVLSRLKGPGLAHCKGMKGLKALDLSETGVTDAGLVGVRNLTQLETLKLPPAITDAGFVHLAGLKNLEKLEWHALPGLKGSGLKHLRGLARLSELDLRGTALTDEGVQYLVGLSQLRKLTLPKQIGNAGVAHLAGLNGLVSLALSKSKVTDAGLAHLAGLKKLKYLYLSNTAVSKEAIEKLEKTLPDIYISK